MHNPNYVNYNNSNNEQEGIAWDLRLTFVKIVGQIMERIAIARGQRNYKDWFCALEELEIEVEKNFNKPDIKEYRELKNEVEQVIKANNEIYLNNNKDNNKRVEILNEAISKLDKALKRKMQEKGLFGMKDDDDSEGL